VIFCAGRRNLFPVIFETPTWFGDPRLFCRIASKRAFSRTAEKFFSVLGPGDEYSERCCFSYLCGGLNAGAESRVWRGKDSSPVEKAGALSGEPWRVCYARAATPGQTGVEMTNGTKSKVLTCPQCKKHLLLPAGRTQPESDDILSCPTHGEIGRYEDLIKDTAVGEVGDAVEGALKPGELPIAKG
jgi:hypothetical protein